MKTTVIYIGKLASAYWATKISINTVDEVYSYYNSQYYVLYNSSQDLDCRRSFYNCNFNY